MATRPPSKSARINKLVGTRTGKTSHVNRATKAPAVAKRRQQANQGAGRQAISTLVRHGGGKVSSASRKQHNAWFGKGTGTDYANPYVGTKQAFEKIYGDLSDELNNQTMEQNAVRTAYAANVLDQQVDPNHPQDLSGPTVDMGGKKVSADLVQPSIDEQYLGSNLSKYAMEPLARTASVLPNAMYATLEAGYDSEAEGGSYWDQTLAGLKAGGREAVESTKNIPTGNDEERALHGYGDIYELSKNRGDNVFAEAARSVEKNHPFVEQQFARGVGAVGEWYGHPLGRLIGGGKAGIIDGERASEGSRRAYVRQLAEKWAADAETNVVTGSTQAPGGYRYHPTEAAMADHFDKTLNDVYDTAELSIKGGGSKGRYEILNPKMTAGLAGTHGAQALQDSLTTTFRSRVQKLVDGVSGKGVKLSGQAIDYWASLHPDFTEMLDDLGAEMVADGQLPSNYTSQMLADTLSTSDVGHIRRVEQAVIDRKYSPYLQDASDAIAREFKNSYYNAPGIRVGKTVYPVKALGRAFSSLESKFFDDIGKNFRYNSVFPGSLSLDTTRARAWGVRATEDFENEVRTYARDFSKADSVAIQHAIENNTVHQLDPKSKAAANYIQDQYRWMHDDEFTFGARGRHRDRPGTETTPYDPNYTYVYNQGGGKEARTRFKKNRKDTIRDNVRAGNKESAGRFKTSNAKAEGLRPVENAFEALIQRRIKHNRDMVRARFLNDMIDKYGVISRQSPSGKGFAAESRGLSMVNFERLPESIRVNLERTGENAYLPKEMAEMVNSFDDITKWHSGQQGRIQRSFATVMGIIKKAMTLPWPGFHNKNMIGDVFMGLLDHILPKDYALVIQKGMASIGGKDSFFKIIKENPGLDISFRDLWYKYQNEANSGFINSELSNLNAPTKYNLPKRVASRTEQIATDVSGFREDSGRFTHYATAYKQEARELWKAGERNIANIERKASSAALWRVNNYRFDYNALMLWEKQAKTLYFPFYTFIRKAAPTLIQAMYQDPRWISTWTRFLHQRSVGGTEMADSFDGFRVPQDVRDVGYAFVGGQEDEPWYVTNDILPTSVLNSVRTKNPHEFFNSILSQTALPQQIAIEQGTGRQTFLDKPLQDQSLSDYLFSKIPGTREFGQLTSDKSWQEKLISGRIGAGLPIKKLTENQQLYAEQEWQDRMIDDPLQDLNYSQDLYYVSKQPSPDGRAEVFTVKNKSLLDQYGNATDVASFYTPQEAIAYVKQNMPDGYKKQPKTYDIDNQGNPVYRPVGN